jgi:predicted permease
MDLRYAFRLLRTHPAFAAAVVLTLALGIGANTVVFSVLNVVLLKPLPHPDPDKIVLLTSTWQGRESFPGVSAPKFNEWRRSTDAFVDAAAYRIGGVANLTDADQPEQLTVGRVSARFFHLFGASVAHGRTFSADEDRPRGPRVVVVSDGFWRRRLGGSPGVVGHSLSIDGDSYGVIGVLGPGFDQDALSLSAVVNVDVWLPLQLDPVSRSDAPVMAAARLRDGFALEIAQTQTTAAANAIREIVPSVMPAEASLGVEPLHAVAVGDVRPALLMLMASVGFVLLISCTNTASLLIARASARQREIAIRLATGASRWRLTSQLLMESLVLALSGGLLGVLLAMLGLRALAAAAPIGVPRLAAIGPASAIDWVVLGFTLVVSMAAGVIFGLAPLRQAYRIDVDATLRTADDRVGAGRSQTRLRAALVISEVAIALTLLVGSALMIRSFVALRSVHPGFDSQELLTMQTAITGRRFATAQGTSQLLQGGIEQIRSLPGVDAVAATLTGAPLSGNQSFLNVTIPGRALGPYYAGGYLSGWHLISPEYFDVFSIPLLAGRPFTDRDTRDSAPVVVVNQAMARQFWPDESTLGHHIRVGAGAGPDFEETTPRQIVGVVGNVRHVGLEFGPRPTAYVPLTQMSDNQAAFFNAVGGRLTWVVRTRQEPHQLAPLVQNELRQASGVSIAATRSMSDVSLASTASAQFEMGLMVGFGGLALIMAVIGVCSVMTYTVQQQTRDIGIRIALGADASAVRNMVLIHGLRLTLYGVAIGIAASLGLVRLMERLLFGITPYDAVAFVSMPLLLASVACAAIWLPARRAARIDPLAALRRG